MLSISDLFDSIVVPVKLKGGSHFVDGLRQILLGDLRVPLQAAGQGRIGKVG